ncbi:MAG TPA: RNA polymerase sigma factor [Tepidisphaeraceae bacterium]|jgi:RNA polymerase sigma factor (sigma-70 family)
MTDQPDICLLRAWVTHRDREAVGELIRRHIDLVYATARREVGDPHLAEDVTQAVFILLLQKASRIESGAAMAGWLFTTTRYAAANARKLNRRREYHERVAASMADTDDRGQIHRIDDAEERHVLLNEAIAQLPRTDRACVVMRFLESKSHRQVADALGVSEDAARVRLRRAIVKLREHFAGRGRIAAKFRTDRLVAPAGLVESTFNVAVLAQQAGLSAGAASAIAKSVAKMIFTTKLKITAAACVALAATGLVTAQVARQIFTPAVLATTAQMAPPTTDPSTVSLGDGVVVRFAGVSRVPSTKDSWHSIDGKPVPRPGDPRRVRAESGTDLSYQVFVEITCPEDAGAKLHVPDFLGGVSSSGWSSNGRRELISMFKADPGTKSADVEVTVADGPWKALGSVKPRKPPWQEISALSTPNLGGITFSPVFERNGQSVFYVTVENMEPQWRLAAIDLDGHPHEAMARNASGVGKLTTAEFIYDLPPQMIAALEVQIRPYRKHVVVKNITLDPAEPTKPEIQTKVDAEP